MFFLRFRKYFLPFLLGLILTFAPIKAAALGFSVNFYPFNTRPIVTEGDAVTLSVSAYTSPVFTPVSYQWYSGSYGSRLAKIPGATSSQYTTPPTTLNTLGPGVVYSCEASMDPNLFTAGGPHSKMSDQFLLDIRRKEFSVTAASPFVRASEGSRVILGVTTRIWPVQTVYYQWYYGSEKIPGATSATYVIPEVSFDTGLGGPGLYKCAASNTGSFYALVLGTTTSDTIRLAVTATKTSPNISLVPSASTITYGQSLSNAILSGGNASVPGNFAFADPQKVPDAGTALQVVKFTPTDTTKYRAVSVNVNVTVNKKTPIISINPMASEITYGEALSNSTLAGGNASVAGNFAFTTPANVPSLGTTSQAVIFTPIDFVNYNTVTANVSVTVGRGTPVVTWNTPAAITYGTSLSATHLNASASVNGTFSYTPATGTVLNAGNQTLSTVFTPSDSIKYKTTIKSVSVSVIKATPTIAFLPNISPISYGQELSSATFSGGSASVAGSFAFTAPANVPSGGISTQQVTFTPTDSANYNIVSANANVTVTKGIQTIGNFTEMGYMAYSATPSMVRPPRATSGLPVTLSVKSGPAKMLYNEVSVFNALGYQRDVALDDIGNVYGTATDNNKILKMSPAGELMTLAGSGTAGSVDGLGAAASFRGPRGLAVDSIGNIYVADTINNKIRKITPAGAVTTLAGSGAIGSIDGTGIATSFYWPIETGQRTPIRCPVFTMSKIVCACLRPWEYRQ